MMLKKKKIIRDKAKEALIVAKELEAERIKKGWRWVYDKQFNTGRLVENESKCKNHTDTTNRAG